MLELSNRVRKTPPATHLAKTWKNWGSGWTNYDNDEWRFTPRATSRSWLLNKTRSKYHQLYCFLSVLSKTLFIFGDMEKRFFHIWKYDKLVSVFFNRCLWGQKYPQKAEFLMIFSALYSSSEYEKIHIIWLFWSKVWKSAPFKICLVAPSLDNIN